MGLVRQEGKSPEEDLGPTGEGMGLVRQEAKSLEEDLGPMGDQVVEETESVGLKEHQAVEANGPLVAALRLATNLATRSFPSGC